MNGVIFTEFIELVEEKFGIEMVQLIIEKANLVSGGVYTTVGSYPHKEIVQLTIELHKATGIPVADLLVTFGRYLFEKLATAYAHFLQNILEPFGLLSNLEKVIHVQVKKLYPQSHPPIFETVSKNEKELIIIYNSHRSLADVAEGLIYGCGDFYKTPLAVAKNYLNCDGTKVQFNITKI